MLSFTGIDANGLHCSLLYYNETVNTLNCSVVGGIDKLLYTIMTDTFTKKDSVDIIDEVPSMTVIIDSLQPGRRYNITVRGERRGIPSFETTSVESITRTYTVVCCFFCAFYLIQRRSYWDNGCPFQSCLDVLHSFLLQIIT